LSGYRSPALQRAAGYHRLKDVVVGVSAVAALETLVRDLVDPVRVEPMLPDRVRVGVWPIR